MQMPIDQLWATINPVDKTGIKHTYFYYLHFYYISIYCFYTGNRQIWSFHEVANISCYLMSIAHSTF